MKQLLSISIDEETQSVLTSCDADNDCEYSAIAFCLAELIYRNNELLEDIEDYLFKKMKDKLKGKEQEPLELPDFNAILKGKGNGKDGTILS